jgi:hypothetical protein
MKSKRGRVLKIKMGVNPNSSSIGTDVIYLMLGSASYVMLVFAVSGIARLFRKNRNDATT